MKSKILSVSILHRHGARGPGDSELKQLAEGNLGKTQWEASDIENITEMGHQNLKTLGVWYCKYAKKCFKNCEWSEDHFIWRVSKSERAKESAVDFVESFNQEFGSRVIDLPCPLPGNADSYFRPWKICSEEVNLAKVKVQASAEYAEKVLENEAFLLEISQIANLKEKVKPHKILWSMTHLLNLLECEMFWVPEIETTFNDLPKLKYRSHLKDVTRALEDADRLSTIKALACWVWERRFLQTDYSIELGGKLALEIFQQLLSGVQKVSIYSAHDYTLLGFMAGMDLTQTVHTNANFGAYFILELWDGPPPALHECMHLYRHDDPSEPLQHTAGTESKTEDISQQSYIRILYNPAPFHAPFDSISVVSTVTEDSDEVISRFEANAPVDLTHLYVFADIPLVDLKARLQVISDHFERAALASPKTSIVI